MRDGVELLADHYVPRHRRARGHTAGPRPVRPRLSRSPRCSARCTRRAATTSSSRACAAPSARAASSTRSCTRSTTAPTPPPGCATQPWFTGTFATVGLSYLGFTQWALLTDPPPEMKAAVITVGPHDVSGPRWGTGSFGLNDFLGWSDLVARQEDPSRLRVLLRQARSQRLVTKASLGLPLGEASRAMLGDGAPWFESWLDHPEPRRPVLGRGACCATRWTAPRCRCCCYRLAGPVRRPDRRAVPRGCASRGVTDRPDHRPMDPRADDDQGRPDRDPGTLDWLGTHLGGRARATARAGAHPRRTGGWLARPCRLAAADARARALPPTRRTGSRTPHPMPAHRDDLRLQPRRPDTDRRRPAAVPGRRLPRRHRAGAPRRRADVHRRPAARRPVRRSARRCWRCSTRCANPHNDVFVRISEVDADGRSRNVSDGYRGRGARFGHRPHRTGPDRAHASQPGHGSGC